MKKVVVIALMSFLGVSISAQVVTDPPPYAQIANPLPDTTDQKIRDSANLDISPIRVNQAGYRPEDEKLFYYVGTGATQFTVIDAVSGTQVGSGTLTATGKETDGQLKMTCYYKAQLISGGAVKYSMLSPEVSGAVSKGLIPDLPPGKYKIKVGSEVSAPFVINESVYSWVKDALLKYYGIARCGDNESWFHKACHLKDPVVGGWHDAGDHIKIPQSIGYAMSVLALGAAALKDADGDSYSKNQAITRVTDGLPDVLKEATIGADFVINSYAEAGNNVANMKLAIAMGGGTATADGCGFGPDHMWWGRPEYQDNVPTNRGGPPRPTCQNLGGNTCGSLAAGMAMVGKLSEPYDAEYSKQCIKIARELYGYGKANPAAAYNGAMSGGGMTYDELAFAAMALWWATKDTTYRYDLLYNPATGSHGVPDLYKKGGFKAGWFVKENPGPQKTFTNTNWDNVEVYALWGLYRLILMDEATAASYGVSAAERLNLIEDVIYCLIVDIGDVSLGDQTVTLPASDFGWKSNILKCDGLWGWMHIDLSGTWMPNRYQSGNITELYCYYDIASKIQGVELPNSPATTDWKANEVKSILLKQLDYMLGMNPWDISMVTGVGNKNLNHPHHRAATPELQNTAGAFYKYSPPVGALSAGYLPTVPLYDEYMGGSNGYFHTEVSLDATTAIFLPIMGLAKKEVITAPGATVRTVYVGCIDAIIEVRQDKYGNAEIHYGTGDTPSTTVVSDSAGVFHRFELTGLTKGTRYVFEVKVSDLFGNDSTIKDIDEEKKPVYFEFTTLQNCPTDANITKVKVCKVTHDSAEIFWYTPNGDFDSKVVYGETKPPSTVQDGDISGHPVKFHYVKLGNLKEKTTYYFYVQSGDSKDDNSGQFYKFTTAVEHVDFDIRAVRYVWGGMTTLGMNIINQDVKAYDSLDVRIYFRAEDGLENDLGARMDIGIVYDEAGFQKEFTENTDIRTNIMREKPVKMPDTYNATDGTYAYYLSVPLWGVQMKSGSRIRLDIVFDRRSRNAPYEDLMNAPPDHVIGNNDWSFGPHSKASGAPYDYSGIPEMAKEDVDENYWSQEINYYMTVYRKGEFVWGYSPSQAEQETKQNHYEMVTQITSPLNNPSEDYVFYARTIRSVDVTGWAQITPVDGKINDLWVNGVPVTNLSSILKWNETHQRYDFTVPVPVQNGRNNVDITIFGGPDESCDECYGCASSNHSFYIEFQGAKQYPSTITLKDADMNPVPDTARIDTTKFHVIVTDRNGNQNGKGKDTLYVKINNPVMGDSINVMLIETGDSTGTFQTVSMISVVDKSADQTGSAEIAMSGGDKLWITYIDPTDPTDISEVYLVSKADFPVAQTGALYDSNGDGTADRIIVNYNKPITVLPDSISFGFPDGATIKKLEKDVDAFTSSGSSVIVGFREPLGKDVTAFSSGGKGSGKSYMPIQNVTKTTAFTLFDSIGPVISAPAVLYERSDEGKDTLKVTFSEGVIFGAIYDSILIITQNEKDYRVSLISVMESDPANTVLTMIVDAKSLLIQEGDSICINPNGSITDNFGNHAHQKNKKMPITLKAAPPKILSAFYTDKNADGRLDKVGVKFNKPISLDDMNFAFTWNNGGIINISKTHVSYDGTDEDKVVVNIEDIVTGNQIVTGGQMSAIFKHKDFPNAEIKADVSDSAAPVIVSALFAPSGNSSGEIIDTLTVSFSENVSGVSGEQPFTFYSAGSGKEYSMKMKGNSEWQDQTKTFYVSEFVNIDFPGLQDSIKIDVTFEIRDLEGNIQKDVRNRWAVMTAKPVPFIVTIKMGPNPFVIDSSVFQSPPDLPNEKLDKKGVLIRVTPESRIKRKIVIEGEIEIFDALGKRVISAEFLPGINTSNIYFSWNGRNKYGRYVGSGTYLAYLTIRDESKRTKKEKLRISIKR